MGDERTWGMSVSDSENMVMQGIHPPKDPANFLTVICLWH